LSIGWSFISAIITVALFIPFSELFSLTIDFPLYYPAAYILGNMLISFGNAFCYSKYRFVLPGMVAGAINLLLILLLTGARHLHAEAYFIPVYFLSFLLHGSILFMLILIRFKKIPSFNFSRINLKSIFNYSLHAYAGNLLFLLMNRVDYLFVRKYCTPGDLGNYIQVSKAAQLFLILPSIISTVLFPVIAGGLKHAVATRVRTLSVMIIFVYSLALLLLLITGYWLFPFLYGGSFNKMYWPFVLLIPGILALSSLYPYNAYYSAIDKLMINIRGSFFAVLVIVAGDALLIPVYGIRAAALISSAGYVVYHAYVVSVFKKEHLLSFKELFILSRQEYLYILKGLIHNPANYKE
ncbi:MAG: oligosaccharide flippase family protein, partial [Chitinophagaceae bacterium]|nr:oligosaccharide flippase family protein [Chitinophagaceae bacterium]